MRGALVVVSFVLTCTGCITGTRATRDRGFSNVYDRPPLITAPQVNRCDKLQKSSRRASDCADAKYLAELYVRKLSAGDEVCLQNGFGEKLTGECLARAAVVDTESNQVSLEVRSAKPDSKYFNQEQHQFWFEEGALVDLYLSEHGY